MISTGAFLNEMDASNKQPTVAEKFAAVWEKKNAKAARAGGASLMALSLAACGSSSTTTTSSTTSTTTTTTTATDAAKTLVLTTGVDLGASFTGGSGDDLFDASLNTNSAQTMGGNDILDGGAGTDQLVMEYKDAVTPISIKNIETIVITDKDASTEIIDMSNVTGMTTLTVRNAATAVDVNNIVAIPTLNIEGQSVDVDIDFVAAAIAGTADNIDVNLSAVIDGDVTIEGVETVTITSGGSVANTMDINDTGTTLTKVVVKGAQDLTLNDTTDLEDLVTTVDASAFTGDLTVQGTSGDVNMTITGGSGDDTFDMIDEYEITDVLDGGAGADVLRADDADISAVTAALTDAKFKNIETVFADTQVQAGINLTYFNGATTLKMAGLDGAANDRFTFADDNTWHLTADIANGAASAAVNAYIAGTGTDDTLNLKLDAGVDNLEADNGLIFNGIENVVIQTATTAGTLNDFKGVFQLAPTAGGASNITITGANAVTFSGAITAGVVDGSAMTGALTLAAAMANAATVQGGSKNDTLLGSTSADVLKGNAGDDAIFGDGGNDVIYLGTGQDQVDFDTTAANNGADTIYNFSVGATADGGDELDLSDFTDVTATSITSNITSLTGAATIADNKIYTINMAAAINGKDYGGADFGDLIGAGKVFAAAVAADTVEAILVVQGTDETHVYLADAGINTTAGSTLISADVALVATLVGVTNSDTFVDANFV